MNNKALVQKYMNKSQRNHGRNFYLQMQTETIKFKRHLKRIEAHCSVIVLLYSC